MDDLQQLKYAIDCLYLLLAGLLVMLLQAGLMLFQVGMVRAKNTIDILLKNTVIFALVSVVYLFIGYAIMYPADALVHPYFPLLNVGQHPHTQLAGVFFQMMVAGVAISIVIGATAERIKPGVLSVFAIVFAALIYPVEGYWVWGKGFLHQLGFMDAAGAGVVHLAGAAAAFAAVVLLGPRAGRYSAPKKSYILPGANMPMATLGVWLASIGSFGFNAGYQLTLDSNLMATAFINTSMAIAGGILSVMLLSRLLFGKADLTLTLNGALVGLVAISGAPETANIEWALMLGAIGGIAMLLTVMLLNKIKIDDPVGAIAVHGIGGGWGLLAVAFTQDYSRLSITKNMPWTFAKQWLVQWIGIWVISVWVFAITMITLLIIRLLVGLRVRKTEEYQGLDLTEYGMAAYPEFTPINKG